jgi:hypothetical protein
MIGAALAIIWNAVDWFAHHAARALRTLNRYRVRFDLNSIRSRKLTEL